MDNSFIPEELRWTAADQAKFGTPNTESIKQVEHEIEDHDTANQADAKRREINGVEATKDEAERAAIQPIMLDGSQVAQLELYLTTRNQNLVDVDVATFRILEYHDLLDGFWGRIDLLTFHDGTQAYRVNINIAPPEAEENYGTFSLRQYASIEEARANLTDELQKARAHGLKSTQEGGVVGQPIYFRIGDENDSMGEGE